MNAKDTDNYTSLSEPSGDILHGSLDMQYNNIINLTDPMYLNDAATKKYVDNKASNISNDLDMNNHKIINLSDPTNNNNAAIKTMLTHSIMILIFLLAIYLVRTQLLSNIYLLKTIFNFYNLFIFLFNFYLLNNP